MTSWGVYGCAKCIQDGFLAEKTRKDTTWSVPRCFLMHFLDGLNVYSSFLLCEKIDPLSVSQNSPVS